MKLRVLLAALTVGLPVLGQTLCQPTPAYSPCDIVFELSEADAAAHPNPYLTVQLEGEFRSPRFKTFRMPAFWDGGNRLVLRFAPTEAGPWDFRITSNLKAFDGKTGQVTATASDSPGFIRPANVHHWAYTENNKPHLWMGDTSYRFAYIDRAVFDQMVEARANQKFNHIRGLVMGTGDQQQAAFPDPDRPDPEHFQELDSRILAMNRKGIIADLVLAGDEDHLVKVFPTWQQRERYLRYLIGRYAPMNITWQGVQEFEEYADGRGVLKEIGLHLKKFDPYNHPRSTHAVATSAPLLADGWMDYRVYQSSDIALGAVEQQLYAVPAVNAEFAYEDSGAGKSHDHHVDTDTFRHRLWNATMNGQYPTFGNTGTYGGRKFEVNAKYLDSPGAKQMTVWFDFFSRTRHWELEPYFDVDGGRALALDSVEYIVYVEKPSGPVEVLVAKNKYDVSWINPQTGEAVKGKEFKSEKFTGDPPGRDHDWVLHISREGRKESMLRSYKFESRRMLMQEVEQSLEKVPFEVAEPAGGTIASSQPVKFSVKLKRDTRATRSMMYVWTGEVMTEGGGYRVLATGAEGQLKIPAGFAGQLPAILNLRVTALNANGKAYSLDKVYTLK